MLTCPRSARDAPATGTQQERVRPRWHGFDALRGLAMLLGVILHAAICYMTHDIPDLVWAAHDRATSLVFDGLFWGIHSFRLPLFFALAGFFAVVLYEARGPWVFLVHRTCRLLIPFLVVGLVLLPLTFLVWSLGWLDAGLCTLRDIRRMKFAPQLQANLYGPAHLWFLLYLYVICLLYGIFRRLLGCCTIKGTRLSPCLDRVPASPWFPLLVSIPTGLIVAFAPETVYGFHNSFCPEPSRLVYYGLFFVAGTWLARIRAVLDIFLIPWCGFNLLICVPLALANGLLLHNYLHGNLTQYGRAALGTTCALLASFSLFGLLGLAQMLCRRENALLRFLADSSYWVYLIHFPLIGLGHVLLTHVPGLALLKFCLVAGVTMAFGLWTYARLVRGRVLGRLLNGTRTVKERKPFLSPAQERPREAA